MNDMAGTGGKDSMNEWPNMSGSPEDGEKLRCAVVGYASEDRKTSTELFQGLGRTTVVRSDRAPVTEPGAVYFFARALRRSLVPTAVISWLGNDRIADRFVASLHELGVDSTGVSQSGTRSPTTQLFYGRDGEVASFYDPGNVATGVTDTQRSEIERARAVIMGVAPSQVVLELLELVPKDAWLTWAVKADPAAVTPAVAQALAGRADAICLSESEREFLTADCGLDLDALSYEGTIIVTTMGPEGVECALGGEVFKAPARERLDIRDPTGAGDTFAAGLTAVLACSTGSDLTVRPTRAEIARAIAAAASDAADLIIERKRRNDVC